MITYLFLLGGHDLEMLEIRSLLIEQKQAFIDRRLAWGAKMSDYADILEAQQPVGRVVVGIELTEDLPIPAFYQRIDHHNELSHLPSSIEQVATLLGGTLSRHRQLIAANDKGYIPAMQQMGATVGEIAAIRRLDRQAQGVTEEMEKQAEADLRLINTENNVTVVHTKLIKFSPIADRLQVPRLLIFNSSELTYYGKRAAELATLFANEVASGRAYYGGGPNGFFGIGKGYFDSEQIRQYVERIRTYFSKAL